MADTLTLLDNIHLLDKAVSVIVFAVQIEADGLKRSLA